MRTEADIGAATTPARGAQMRRWPMWIAAALSLFACVTLNSWIYSVHGMFLALHPDGWPVPTTISRAAAPPEIARPFSFWVTLSGIALVAAVALMSRYYARLPAHAPAPALGLRWMLWLGVPAAVVLQGVSGLGMYWLSVYTLINNPPMHMVGSVTFFAAQALVIMIYAGANFALLRDPSSLQALAAQGFLQPRMVLWRLRAALLSIGLAVVYGVLFVLKDIYVYPEVKWVHLAYVTLEPVVISGYLFIVALACVDKLGVPRNAAA